MKLNKISTHIVYSVNTHCLQQFEFDQPYTTLKDCFQYMNYQITYVEDLLTTYLVFNCKVK